MVNTFVLVVLATFVLSSHASNIVRYLAVQTSSGNKCDFSVWDDYDVTPAYANTCVRMYKTRVWWKAPYPWCYQEWGSWDYCLTYTWNVEYSDDSRLLKNDSKTKEYYFNYYQIGTTYEDARKICQNKGRGWDVASFQAFLPKGERGEFLNYERSVKNIEEALSPLIETWDAFWVKNEDNKRQCLDFDKNSFLQETSCDNKRTFVCERGLYLYRGR